MEVSLLFFFVLFFSNKTGFLSVIFFSSYISQTKQNIVRFNKYYLESSTSVSINLHIFFDTVFKLNYVRSVA